MKNTKNDFTYSFLLKELFNANAILEKDRFDSDFSKKYRDIIQRIDNFFDVTHEYSKEEFYAQLKKMENQRELQQRKQVITYYEENRERGRVK